MTKKVFIFDFDGTIVDSMSEFADIASIVLNKHFGTPVDIARRQYFETSGLPFFEQVEILHPGDPKNGPAANEYEETKKINYLNHKKFDDVDVSMSRLKKNGIKTVVSSNNFQELVDALVEKLGLKFDLVLGWRKNFAKGKDHFEFARRHFVCELSDMVFVGDSIKDAERARDYEIDFIAKAGTFSREEFKKSDRSITVIESLNELNC